MPLNSTFLCFTTYFQQITLPSLFFSTTTSIYDIYIYCTHARARHAWRDWDYNLLLTSTIPLKLSEHSQLFPLKICKSANFVVPLHPHSVKSTPLALKAHRGICFREASEILAQTRCCDLQYRLFRI